MTDEPKRRGMLESFKDDAIFWFWIVVILGGVALIIILVKWILGVEA